MIDLHCHLLPGIDDGPATLKEALALAVQAVESGVTHAILTPHIHPGRWDNTATTISEAVAAFKGELDSHSIPLTVGFAGEVRVGAEILTSLIDGELPFLGKFNGRNVLLLEMPHSNIPLGTDKIVSWLIEHNVLPMIAHPERNKDVMRSYKKLAPFVKMGCLFQVTAGSLVGQFGGSAQSIAEQMLNAGLVTVLASDAHHITRRPCNLNEGFAAAIQIVGESEAQRLVKDIPLAISACQFRV